MASIAVERLNKVYPNGHRAILDFSLRVEQGELMAFVGPSGCGKSTLLRLLAGLEQAESGTIRIGERIANALSPQERNIAMVFQDYALYPTMTVRGNLEFPLKMRKLDASDRQRRIEWAAELLALTDVLDRLPRQLSGGQRQRVAMGRALVREPSVFLLDEPLSNLDAKLRVQVRAEIVDLQRRTGTTMVYVTHDQVEAMTMGHRIAVLHGGMLQQVGKARDLYEHPANLFVAGFIGTPPMNLLPAAMLSTLEAKERRERGDAPRIEWPRSSWRLAENHAELAGWTAGVRPENIRVGSERPGYPAVITELEYLGHETLIHFQFAHAGTPDAGALFVARTDGSCGFRLEQQVYVSVRPGGMIWFDERGLLVRQ